MRSLLKPATLDLAGHVGASLARDSLPSERRILLNRIASRFDRSARVRMIDAYMLASEAPKGWHYAG